MEGEDELPVKANAKKDNIFHNLSKIFFTEKKVMHHLSFEE
jgi:hypothetical protein